MIGELESKAADLGASPLFFTADRTNVIEYIACTSETRSKFVFRSPKLSYTDNVFLMPFDSYVWGSLGALILVASIILYFASHTEWKSMFVEDSDDPSILRPSLYETFFVLFQNRGLLLLFNEMLAGIIANSDADESIQDSNKYLASTGRFKRVAIPSWVKRAVYFRDRGFCVMCQKDLSGILNIRNTKNYDHVVPLVRGGLNDISNIQLLCQSCNAKKKGRPAITSNVYEAWY